MDRGAIERLLASAVRPATRVVQLPSLGAQITLRRPTREEATRVMAAAGSEDDAQARMLIGVLRWALVDDHGHAPLLTSYAEAAGFFNAVPEADLPALMAALGELFNEVADTEALDVEAGKAS
jgi:hypothetical protein